MASSSASVKSRARGRPPQGGCGETAPAPAAGETVASAGSAGASPADSMKRLRLMSVMVHPRDCRVQERCGACPDALSSRPGRVPCRRSTLRPLLRWPSRFAAPVIAHAGQQGGARVPRSTTQDYIDIQQLNARYAVAIDECTNNGYDYAALYTEDGWFGPSRNGRCWRSSGPRQAGRSGAREHEELRRSPVEGHQGHGQRSPPSCRRRRAYRADLFLSPSASTAIRIRSSTRAITKMSTRRPRRAGFSSHAFICWLRYR